MELQDVDRYCSPICIIAARSCQHGWPGTRLAGCPLCQKDGGIDWYASLLACVIVACSALIVAMISALVFTG